MAWQVTRDYNEHHLKMKDGLAWHFSGAGLSIWLTRNWTTDQLLARVAEMRRHQTK